MRTSFSLLPLLLLAAIGCDGDVSQISTTDEALARWRAAALQHYQVEQRIVFICNTCDGGSAEAWARVEVRGGQVVAVDYAEGAFVFEAEGMPRSPLETALTVEEVFERLAAAQSYGHGTLEASFNPVLGYPTRFSWVSSDGEVREEIKLRNLRAL